MVLQVKFAVAVEDSREDEWDESEAQTEDEKRMAPTSPRHGEKAMKNKWSRSARVGHHERVARGQKRTGVETRPSSPLTLPNWLKF